MSNGEIELWKDLVILPHKKTKPIVIREPKYNPQAFFEFCKKYDIDSFRGGMGKEKWERFFAGNFGGPKIRTRGGLI
jgi:hypothetical protein